MMERMTERSERGNAYYPQCFKEPCEGMECKIEQCKFSEAACDRLAAYEDSGLSPEDAANLHAILRLGDGMTLMRLRELAEADKDGRVVVPPCKVGDVVYGFHGEKTILPMVAKWIETNTDGWCITVQYTPMAPRFYRFSDFGKTVFLTREEAEKALAEMEGKRNNEH